MAKGNCWNLKTSFAFGNNNFYLELQPSFNKEQIYVNSEIIKISEMLDIPYIITTDSHYKNKEDVLNNFKTSPYLKYYSYIPINVFLYASNLALTSEFLAISL